MGQRRERVGEKVGRMRIILAAWRAIPASKRHMNEFFLQCDFYGTDGKACA
jgi:hypothetical protein